MTAPRKLRLEQLSKLMDTLSYRNVLARGYAIVQDGAGQVVTDAAVLKPGDPIHVILSTGEVDASVNGAPPRRKIAKPQPDTDPQESLF